MSAEAAAGEASSFVATDLVRARRGVVADVKPIEPTPAGSPAAASVVIVNYNAGPVLRDCILAVLPQARQVVVVDNASEPAGFEASVAGFGADPRVVIIRSETNLGFAAGCNRGIAVATEPYLLFLNPDSIVRPGAVSTMCTVLAGEAGAGMAGGFLIGPDGSEQGGGRRAVPTPWRSAVRAFGLSRLAGRWPKLFDDFYLHRAPCPTGPIAVEAISGACMLVKREVLEDVGPFDEGYFLHCEDLDLCMRLRQRGWSILFVPDAPVLHHKGVCSRDRRIFVEWHKHRGMMRFYNTHFRHQYPAGLMALVGVGVWTRFAGLAVLLGVRGLPRRGMRLVRRFMTAAPVRSVAPVVAPVTLSDGVRSGPAT